MFLALVIEKSGGTNMGLDIDLATDGRLGMCPVYKTREQAEKDYPNAEIIEVFNPTPEQGEE